MILALVLWSIISAHDVTIKSRDQTDETQQGCNRNSVQLQAAQRDSIGIVSRASSLPISI